MTRLDRCPICGGDQFILKEVLWEELIREWGLNQLEVKYINKQQGLQCIVCNSNLRSMALAKAFLKLFSIECNFNEIHLIEKLKSKTILEINAAGNLTNYLQKLTNHILVSYPEVQMENLPFDDESFDLIIHSDTLEHVRNPNLGIEESFRVLRTGGFVLFTIPIIVDRQTKTRQLLPPSYHGQPLDEGERFLVFTEYGADFWKDLAVSGFESVSLHFLEFPSGIAVSAKKSNTVSI
jgi:SAM-dependent methyltransferase